MAKTKAEVFDLKAMPAFPYEQREKNVFVSKPGFKARIIDLPPGGNMPECDMPAAVLFSVVSGQAEITVDGVTTPLGEGMCLIGEPGRYSMRTVTGVRLLGVQLAAGQGKGAS